MFKSLMTFITITIVILLSFFGCVFLGELVMDLMSAKSTISNIVGLSITIIFIILCFHSFIPFLVIKIQEFLRRKELK